MKRIICILLVLLAALVTHGQKSNNFWNSPNAYLGETPPNDTPKIFAHGKLTEPGAWAGDRVAFSADGKEFYYSHNTTWFSNQNAKLKYVKYSHGRWSKPMVAAEKYYAPTFSADEKIMYLIGGPQPPAFGPVVSQAHRTDTGWTKPAVYIRKPYALYDFMPTLSGNMYVGSNVHKDSVRIWSDYNISKISVVNGDTSIKSLGVPVNAPGFNGDFFVAKDESYLIISYHERPSFECDLAISYHKPDGTWTNPKSLGPLVNNDIAHRWGEYVSPDGKYLFYTHGHNEKNCFIYWVRFDTLMERLKHTNFEPYVKSPLMNQTATSGKAVSILIPDHTFLDDDGNDTLIYMATLSDGAPLPAGLSFIPEKKVIVGTPKETGSYMIKVTAIDNANTSVSSSFILNVK